MKFKIDNNKEEINSEDIKKILSERDDFETVQDISNLVNESYTMAFDCKLEEDILSLDELNELLEELDELGDDASIADLIQDGTISISFEDVRAYLKDATDEIEADLREKYKNDNIRCFFNVYRIDESFTDFKFVFVVSFKEIGIAYLTSLTNILGRNQLNGSSKFYS
ncbi:MAG: hypothetical protein ACRCXT_10855 [Paraclostridium sp.]